MNDLEKGKKSYSPSVSGWLARIFNLNENAVRWFLNIVLFIIFFGTVAAFMVIACFAGPPKDPIGRDASMDGNCDPSPK